MSGIGNRVPFEQGDLGDENDYVPLEPLRWELRARDPARCHYQIALADVACGYHRRRHWFARFLRWLAGA